MVKWLLPAQALFEKQGLRKRCPRFHRRGRIASLPPFRSAMQSAKGLAFHPFMRYNESNSNGVQAEKKAERRVFFKRMFQPILWLALALSVTLLALMLFLPGARLQTHTASEPLRFIGEYALEGSAQRYPLTDETDFSTAEHTQVTLYGHFDRAVAPNAQIIMRISNLRVTLRVNGRTVFAFGGDHPALVKSGGNVWTAFTSNGILPTDAVELQLANVYTNDVLSSYRDFFSGLSTGSEYAVYRTVFTAESYQFIVSLVLLLMGIAMLGLSIYARGLKLARAGDYLYLSGFTIASGIWMSINYRMISLILPYPAFYQTLEMLAMALMPVFLLRYASSLIRKPYQSLCLGVTFAVLLLSIVCIVLQFFGTIDLAELTGVFSLVDMAAIAAFVVCLLKSLRAPRDAETMSSILPLFILFSGALLNFANYFFSWHTSGLFYTVAFLLFAILEMIRLVRTLREGIHRNNEFIRLENELTQSRIAVMLSQIKPHFLFNALNSISALCLTDPIMADQAITSLANYLRGNIRSLEQSAPVPFEQELDHIKYYVRLEQLRYGDRLRVVYAVETTAFQVPTLSLQTLVENAIRHGVSPRPEGGLVVVQTERGDNCTYVRIIDDGVGFDPDMSSQNADSIGLANAKKRMEVMMNADFDIHSVPGKGTVISIRIPDAPGKEKA